MKKGKRLFSNVKVGKYTNRKGEKKWIVYDKSTLEPLSGISGQSRTKAYKIAKNIKEDKRYKKFYK